MTKDEALKLSLAALELSAVTVDSFGVQRKTQQAIAAIKEALAQPVQEPVAWRGYDLDGMVEAFSRVIEAHHNNTNPFHSQINADAMVALRILRGFIPYMKRHTTPPQRPWVGLMRGVRVAGDTVIISVKGANDAARELCGELLKEMEA